MGRMTTRAVLGLDIGGANLKAVLFQQGADASRSPEFGAITQPFALWRDPAGLSGALAALLQKLPPVEKLAVTMTGELCDCFASKREGVLHILDAVAAIAAGQFVNVWTTDGTFLELSAARSAPSLMIAASNWLALATWAGRLAPEGPALLVDVGSTTTDIIPLLDGVPVPAGRNDPERLQRGELVYTGVRRTPICALVDQGVAAEWFATTLDVYLVLEKIEEDATAFETADGRAATRDHAQARLARMLCADLESSSPAARLVLAREVFFRQKTAIAQQLTRVAKSLPARPEVAILSGSGEFLARAALEIAAGLENCLVLSLQEMLGPLKSSAACAYALAVLCAERS
jgi:(4-(4-[2-(gamma-L-glutamylamino)ethyl]phenoxymethyl)furan-2-yl)methanamine synthase